jgi:hypothetical protein
VLNWVSWGNNSLNSLVSVVLNVIPSGVEDSVVIEGIGVIEVLIRDSGSSSEWSPWKVLKISWLIGNNDEIVVGVVVHEVGVVKVEV